MVVYILQIVTICVSVSSLIVTVISASNDTKRKLYSGAIVKQRINDLNNIKLDSSVFYSFIDLCIEKMEKNIPNMISDFSKAKNKLISNFKKEYEEDIQIINLIELIYKNCVKNLLINNDDYTLVLQKENELYDLISKYNSANWSCIKQEVYGKELYNKDFKKFFHQDNHNR